MSAEEKNVISRVSEAFSMLPEGKREFILGWAEGVIAKSDMAQNEESDTEMLKKQRQGMA